MIANVWYPVNYFRISFGKQDRLGNITLALKSSTDLQSNAEQREVFEEVLGILATSTDREILSNVNSLIRYVPYRFLRPWFKKELKGVPDHQVNAGIIDLSAQRLSSQENLCMYRFVGKKPGAIELQKDWFEYLRKHSRILMDFCYWNLLKYLQRKNSNVPNIAEKLFAPRSRNLDAARKYWSLVLSDHEKFRCIYSHTQIPRDEFSIDHFIPWRFVTHDLLWNLVPVPQFVNSIKSDSLPAIDEYFDKFARVQYESFRIVFSKNKPKMLEDYINLYQCDLREIYDMPLDTFMEKLRSTISPLLQIAENMGFQSGWVFRQ